MTRSRALMAGAVAAACAVAGVPAAATAAPKAPVRQYTVVAKTGTSRASFERAVRRAGGTVVRYNRAVAVGAVRGPKGFAPRAVKAVAIVGASERRAIGRVPAAAKRLQRNRAIEHGVDGGRDAAGAQRRKPQPPATGIDPLAPLQWDMAAIGATAQQSYRYDQGAGVRVGIMDTGVDGGHPDIAPNFDRGLSRNFTVDDPVIDGPCAEDPDGSCQDPPDVDEDGHGTHVASTIASPINGLGIGGVAPKADIVNLRVGQDSGYFFTQPTVDALTYAGDHGIDVVNMSFYIDPWLYNCTANPADSPQAQAQQRTTIIAVQRAVDYARSKGVLPVAALGNENTDIDDPKFDDTSPDYPPDAAYERTIDNSCLSVPTETEGVVGVTSYGPTGRKAYYSNWSLDQADLAAPGGDRREFFGTPRFNAPENRILAAYPESVGRVGDTDLDGKVDIDAAGNPTTPLVVKDTHGGVSSYYQWIQGTSMASPHAAGVAALVVAAKGRRDRRNGGLTLPAAKTERLLERSAVPMACPPGGVLTYPDPDLPPSYTARCTGTTDHNSFYGDGSVNALNAVRLGRP
ncbi:Secreted subtilisin-like protease [Patulibacter medicamentivorans]|uniref:Secreted subtilisin-like protease n=1 Tax=Patulibacter medicamentivorans TaxID=1097667 RepID=H0E951_9ACTN|nr:S8 family serine peptidase [Patulibacter medicamentivorans]EHN09789.1 Secreted subtilisin-like protease [Patulibacter medicamentivorans]